MKERQNHARDCAKTLAALLILFFVLCVAADCQTMQYETFGKDTVRGTAVVTFCQLPDHTTLFCGQTYFATVNARGEEIYVSSEGEWLSFVVFRGEVILICLGTTDVPWVAYYKDILQDACLRRFFTERSVYRSIVME